MILPYPPQSSPECFSTCHGGRIWTAAPFFVENSATAQITADSKWSTDYDMTLESCSRLKVLGSWKFVRKFWAK